MEIDNEVRAVNIHEKAKAYYEASENFGYKFLMEVKIIRDEKLFLLLGCSDFDEYTTNYFGYSRNTINDRIQAADMWGEEYNRALGSYGKHKTKQLGLMPNRDEVIQKGIPTNEGMKSIHEATTREIEEYKKQLKEKDERIANLSETVKEMTNQKPKVIEKVVTKEVVPPKYENLESDNQQLIETLKEERKKNERELAKKQAENESVIEALKKENEDMKKMRQMQNADVDFQEMTLKRLKRESEISVYQIVVNIQSFLREQALTDYHLGALANASDSTKEKMLDGVRALERYAKDLKLSLQGKIIFEEEQ